MSEGDFTESEVLPSLSKFIAGLIGPVLVAVGGSMLLNTHLAPEIAAEIAHGKGLILLTGVSLMVAGLAIVQCHSSWRGWPAIITGLGWLSAISGLARIVFPTQLADVATQLTAQPTAQIAAFASLALGAFLTVKAYT